MGAEESKQGGGSSRERDDEEERKKNEPSSSSMGSGGAALAVGAAVGTALLGAAWGIQQYNNRSKASDQHERVDNEHDYEYSPARESAPRINDVFKNLQITEGFNPTPKRALKILSYNVCAREDYYEIQGRMKAIGALVKKHSPDFICFQEFTPAIYYCFSESSWWEDYHCSMSYDEARKCQYFCILLSKYRPVTTIKKPLGTSKMGRELSVVETKVGNYKSMVVATAHLKSPCPDPNDPNSQNHKFKRERMQQAQQAVNILENYPNVIFCGDMNWNEKQDGKFPLPEGWVDAWTDLKGKEKGYTFDTKMNDMLNGRPYLRMRLDRILCNLNDFRLDDIEIIGKEAIPDASYQRNNKQLPVLPSDHYGLLLSVSLIRETRTGCS